MDEDLVGGIRYYAAVQGLLNSSLKDVLSSGGSEATLIWVLERMIEAPPSLRL